MIMHTCLCSAVSMMILLNPNLPPQGQLKEVHMSAAMNSLEKRKNLLLARFVADLVLHSATLNAMQFLRLMEHSQSWIP